MTARPVRLVVGAAFPAGFVVVTTADRLHLLHVSTLLGVGALLGRPRTG